MAVFLLNSLSLSMLRPDIDTFVIVRPLSLEEARRWLRNGFVDAIGHEATARLLTELFGLPIPASRKNIKLSPGDVAIIFQLLERLPEGKVITNVEELSKIPFKFYLIEVHAHIACASCGEVVFPPHKLEPDEYHEWQWHPCNQGRHFRE
jgi:hypothetical protein